VCGNQAVKGIALAVSDGGAEDAVIHRSLLIEWHHWYVNQQPFKRFFNVCPIFYPAFDPITKLSPCSA
jgi:hypothetical protein